MDPQFPFPNGPPDLVAKVLADMPVYDFFAAMKRMGARRSEVSVEVRDVYFTELCNKAAGIRREEEEAAERARARMGVVVGEAHPRLIEEMQLSTAHSTVPRTTAQPGSQHSTPTDQQQAASKSRHAAGGAEP